MFNANIHFPQAVLLLLIRGVAAAEDSSEFTLNLFTDIAPILALFGEQFAQQYLSQSFTWRDHLIFACVPLGIIAALSGAIRTRGPRLARSFIGRARESLATVEIDLMSSVSHEVCEMFNGSGIVRTMGRSTLAQIIILPDVYDAVQRGISNDPSCGIHTLQTALQSREWEIPPMERSNELELVTFRDAVRRGDSDHPSCGIYALQTAHQSREREIPPMERSKYQSKTYRRLQRLINPEDAIENQSNQPGAPLDPKCPPNLQLNVSTGQSSRVRKDAELFTASTTAVALQLSLVAIAAVVTYHGPTSKAVGVENNLYGFPCYVAGSALLCIGMAICSAAIESSTDEYVWTRSTGGNIPEDERDSQSTRDPYIMWIQQPQSVGEQAFESYAILGGSKPYIITSSRSNDLWTAETSQGGSSDVNQGRRRWWEGVTLVGVLLGSAGFIVQFIGLRGLPWPVAVSQLLATVFMALVRALIRRGVGIIPLACPALPGYELDFLAAEIVVYPEFREFKDGEPSNGDLRDRNLSDVCRWKVLTANEKARLTAPSNLDSKGSEDDTDSILNLENDTRPTQGSGAEPRQKSSSQQLVKVRERLADLCKWKTAVSEMAVVLAQSVEHFMEIFFEEKTSEDGLRDGQLDKILWATKTSNPDPNGGDDAEETVVHIERKNGTWVAELGKIEAIMSLWMASIEAQPVVEQSKATDNRSDTGKGDWRRSGGAKVKFRRIVGDWRGKTIDHSLKRDISWWISNDIALECEDEHEASHQGVNKDSSLLIGFDMPLQGNSQPHHTSERRMIHSSTAELPHIMAQHLFTSFIWAATEHMSKNILHQGEPNVPEFVKLDPATEFDPDNLISNWYKPRLSHPRLSQAVKGIESWGLGTVNDILLCMIPALGFRDLLPNEVVLGLMPSIPEGIRQHGCQEMTHLYRKLLARCSSRDGECFVTAVLLETIEFILIASESLALIDTLRSLLVDIAEKFPRTLKHLALGFHLQGRAQKLRQVFRRCGFRHSLAEALVPSSNTMVRQPSSGFREACGFQAWHFEALDRSYTILNDPGVSHRASPDIFGWTPLHYAITAPPQEHPEIARYVGRGTLTPGVEAYSCLDKSHRSPFHIAASFGHLEFLTACFDCVETDADTRKDALKAGGLDGKTPLHLAVEGQHLDCVELLLKHLSPSQADIWGRHPIHVAALGRSYEIGRRLLAHFPQAFHVDNLGNTPLTYLLRNENDETVDQGRTDFAKELMATWTAAKADDDSGNYHLHYAAAFSDEDEIENLVKDLGNVNIPNRQGQTPLHLAALEGRAAAARKLISLGAQVGSIDDKGWNALHYAAGCRDAERDLVSLILNAGRDTIKATNKKSLRTPLHIAAAAGNASAAMLLVSEGVESSVSDKDGDTALQLALKHNRQETLDKLLSCGEVLNGWRERGPDGFQDLDLAIRHCNTKCLSTALLHAATNMPMRIYGLKAMVTDRKWELEDADLFNRVFKSIPEMELSILDLDVLIQMSLTVSSSDAIHQAWSSRRNDLGALKRDPWALHFLAQHGDTATLAQLLEAEADALRLDKDDWIPSDVADSYGQTAAGDLLRDHLAKTDIGRPDKPSYHVPATIRDIYQDPDITIRGARDGLDISVALTNPGLSSAVFRTQECIPPNAKHFYFEAGTWIKNESGKLYVGFCTADLPRDKLPGQHPGSWSYEISTATLTAWALREKDASSQTIESWGQRLNVGCGLNMLTGEGFVTLNGNRLNSETVFHKHKFFVGKVYPCVAFSTHKLRGCLGARVLFSPSPTIRFRYVGPYS
ncbi:B30.2/SPRY domain-containing protein [Fusarium falciforme]|uniref:B30.2/SPRY domain-containing protein n=1 Tax=Fusarium falciforme TaxID=195108 RepID=UPI0022FFCAE1|nr:B30.2/SPRY domain-containing protein [Fusarium falciforme]WAO95424.1 B30.2/SPRY domain-containing protein [Fusarium falciforme]